MGEAKKAWSLAFLALAACTGNALPQPNSKPDATTAPIQAPPGTESLGVQWRTVEAPGVGTILLAVARPAGKGPFPAVVILHGTHGFAREYVQLAKELSRDGVVAVAACWFAPGSGAGTAFVSPVPCPSATPPISLHLSNSAVETLDLIVRGVQSLPDVKADQIALFGHSRGGGLALNYVLNRPEAKAVILNSAGYPGEVVERAAYYDAPILILHGEMDHPADGGGPMNNVERVRAFQAALRRAGKPVEAIYYPGGRHNDLFANPTQRTDSLNRMRAFLRKYLLRPR